MMRKRYSNIFKAEVVKELMKEEKTISQLAAKLGVLPTQLKEWKRIALTSLPELFSRKGDPVDKLTKAHAAEVEELYAEIGRLTTQVNWLKKIWPRPYPQVNDEHWWSGKVQPCRSRCKLSCSV